MRKVLLLLTTVLIPISSFALSLINDFEWLEPNNSVKIAIGESYQLKFNCSNNSLAFTSAYADSWVHIDFDGGQHVVDSPTGYSIDENGVITGLAAGSYAIHPTGWVQRKSGVDKWLYITVSERSEIESNNTLDTANDITSKIRFGLYNISDVDYFKFTNSRLKAGDVVTFNISYYGSRENPFGYKWATFCGTNMVAGGSLNSQNQVCRALVTSGNTVYLEVYYDQSRAEYFKYGDEFVAQVYINGVPVVDGETGNTNIINGHEYVDLDLPSGKCWATTNYGADAPEDYGNYLEWGNFGIVSRTWGEEWRTPSLADIRELENYCSWSWETKNGQNGYTIKGPNGKKIFLPACGFKMIGQSNTQRAGEWVYYWTSTSSSEMAYIILSTSSDVWYGEMNTMFTSLPIRPITSFAPSSIALPSTHNQKCIIGTFDIQGHKLEKCHKGLNIIKFSDGTIKKVMIK